MPDDGVPYQAAEALENPSKRLLKALRVAEDRGWTEGTVLVKVLLHQPVPARESVRDCPACPTGRTEKGNSTCRACFAEGRRAPLSVRAQEAGWPLQATWKMKGKTPTGKPSWGLVSAVLPGGRKVSEGELLKYLEDPAEFLNQLATEES